MKRVYIFLLLLFKINLVFSFFGGRDGLSFDLSSEIASVRLGVSDGLPNNSVRCMFQDSKGFMWFGTLNGLSRYDGLSFKSCGLSDYGQLSLPDHRINDIFEDNNGFLWIKTFADLYGCYNLKTEQFVDFTGCDEYGDYYTAHYLSVTEKNVVWLWGDRSGCRRILYSDGSFSSLGFFKNSSPGVVINDLKNGGEDFTWIATNKGLYYWDGMNMCTADSTGNYIFIQEYLSQTYFIADNGRILKYNDNAGRIEYVGNAGLEPDSNITGAFLCKDILYIFSDMGSKAFMVNTGESVTADKSLSLSNARVKTDNKGNYWVYNNTGVLRYINSITAEVLEFDVSPQIEVDYIDEERFDIIHDSRDMVWISTYGNGLFIYNINDKSFRHVDQDSRYTSVLTASDYLLDLMEDKTGNIWVSSEFTGISKLSLTGQGTFMVFPNSRDIPERGNAVRCLSVIDNDLYVFTRTGNLTVYDSCLRKKSQSVYDTNIYATLKDSDGLIWYATRGKGLIIGDKVYRYACNDSCSLSSDHVYDLFMDSSGRVWVATFGGGLNLAVKQGDKYVFRRFLDETYGQRRVRSICQDSNGWIWAGTDEGLFVFNPENVLSVDDSALRNAGTSELFYHYSHNDGILYSNEIRSIVADTKGNVWIAETGKGFARCVIDGDADYRNLKFEHYGTEDGLVNNMVQTFLEDYYGNIWISTEYGISCFDVQSGDFKNYFFSNNDLGNTYSENCALTMGNGCLAFGTNHGLIVVNPQLVARPEGGINVVFTDLKVNGLSVSPTDDDSPIISSMPYVSEINLNYLQTSFVVEFSTLDYDMGKSKFSCMLQGYDHEWSSPSKINFAAYRNMPYGTYYLRVRACDSSGKWSEMDSVIKININPPLWLTPWAYIVYVLLIIGFVYVVYMVLRRINNLQNKIKIEKQLTEFKLRFFTDISHEFRTPLSLILGAMEKIGTFKRLKKLPKELAYSVDVMDSSTRRMMRLVNQLLEFRKIRENKITLSLEKTDIVAFVYNIFADFNDAAESKKISFTFNSQIQGYDLYIDKEKVDKIVYNLLSNAFKYTPSGGNIELKLEAGTNDSVFSIMVIDTGIGISESHKGELFKRFTGSHVSENSVPGSCVSESHISESCISADSMGIGLNLAYELALAHKGTIAYKENPGGGSVFSLLLPLDKGIYSEENFITKNDVGVSDKDECSCAGSYFKDIVMDTDDEFVERIAVPLNAKRLLIIEDDNDVREYIKKLFEKYFDVVAVSDGNCGIEYVRNNEVDVIISDVMMPGISGFELTRVLKSDFGTSHIPIVLLTALEESENHIAGIEVGADAYITKPFSTRLLMARVFRLVDQREKLREKFSKDPFSQHKVICTNDSDKEFAEQLSSLVDNHLSDADITVDELASFMGLGRTVFYRKVKGVTGYSPNEYIRIKRMRKAAALLLEGQMNISEISYSVGIADPFYFSKCFKSQFGVSPSVYQKSGGKTNVT